MREIAPESPRAGEPRRRFTVGLLFAFYGLILAEGPLRKWCFPSASNAFVFVRDPVMVALLLLSIGRAWSISGRRAWTAYGCVVVLCLGCATLQLLFTDAAWTGTVAGLRNYLLFAPLAWIIAEDFSQADYARWIRLNLWLSGPIGLLVFLQYRAPPQAPINAVPGGGSEGVFLLVEDVVRPYGLFSFTLGHSVFAAWMLGVVLAVLSARRALGVRPALVGGGGLGVAVMGLCSGSRTFFLFAGTVLLLYVVLGLIGTRGVMRRRACAAAAGLVVGMGLLFGAVPGLKDDLASRQNAAEADEGSTLDRIVVVATEFAGTMGDVPSLGFGLGSGTNIAGFLASGRSDRVLAEYELTRMVQELGPFFGLLMILLRWAIAGGFLWAALLAARRGNLQPACFVGLVVPILLVHDITLQNSMIAIAWYAIGITGATLKFETAAALTRPAPLNSGFVGVQPCG